MQNTEELINYGDKDIFHVAANDSSIILASNSGKLHVLKGGESSVIRTRADVSGGVGWGFGPNGCEKIELSLSL